MKQSLDLNYYTYKSPHGNLTYILLFITVRLIPQLTTFFVCSTVNYWPLYIPTLKSEVDKRVGYITP